MTSSIATSSETPVACTLSAGAYKDRLAQIAALARDALRSYESNALTLTLRYDAAVAERVRQMVRREQECCAFLRFVVREEAEEIVVTVSGTEEARIAAETMFEQFVTPAPNGSTKAACVALTCASAAAVCGPACVAPLVLPAAALAGTGTLLAWLAGAHVWITALALLAVAAAWLGICRHASKSGLPPSRFTLSVMTIATLLSAFALVWPLLEPQASHTLGSQ